VSGVVTGFATIAAVIVLGYLLASVRLLDEPAQEVLSRLAFFVALPCLMFTVLAGTPATDVLSRTMLATIGGIALAALPYVLIARLRWRRRSDEIVIGAMASAYTNAGNLGLPIAAYVLGDAALIAPMLLLHLVVLQPIALAILDAGRADATAPRSRLHTVARILRTPVTNPLTIATFAGVVLSVTHWAPPPYVLAPIELVGGMGVPAVLIAYGVSLRLGPLPGRGAPPAELALVATLKLVVQPLGAYLVGRALGLHGAALLALAVTAALPSAQNIFVHAVRFARQQVLARDAIFITTIGCVPAIAIITALLT